MFAKKIDSRAFVQTIFYRSLKSGSSRLAGWSARENKWETSMRVD